MGETYGIKKVEFESKFLKSEGLKQEKKKKTRKQSNKKANNNNNKKKKLNI